MAKISEEEIEKIKKIEGEILGEGLKEDAQFIQQKEGKEGL